MSIINSKAHVQGPPAGLDPTSLHVTGPEAGLRGRLTKIGIEESLSPRLRNIEVPPHRVGKLTHIEPAPYGTASPQGKKVASRATGVVALCDANTDLMMKNMKEHEDAKYRGRCVNIPTPTREIFVPDKQVHHKKNVVPAPSKRSLPPITKKSPNVAAFPKTTKLIGAWLMVSPNLRGNDRSSDF